MRITISGNPVACPRPRVSRWGSYYPKKYVAHREILKRELMELPQLEEIELIFVLKRPQRLRGEDRESHNKRPDLDNLIKTVLDSLPWDDSRISSIRAKKYYAAKNEEPHTEVLWTQK